MIDGQELELVILYELYLLREYLRLDNVSLKTKQAVNSGFPFS
jgi:hypothetical protein